jgi:hypothetical protein
MRHIHLIPADYQAPGRVPSARPSTKTQVHFQQHATTLAILGSTPTPVAIPKLAHAPPLTKTSISVSCHPSDAITSQVPTSEWGDNKPFETRRSLPLQSADPARASALFQTLQVP